ncbi:MAG: hypothetical protein J6B32_05465 [Spirochaetaceae bacterium]|nr:hypothetical protein [Spirochaetaceae bacterium]
MTSLIFCSIIVFVNIVLWIIFFVRQKKRFSPDRILSEIEKEIEKMILSLHHETDNCVTMVKGTKEGLIRLLNDAKRYTELATKDLSTMARSQGIIQTINNSAEKKTVQRNTVKKIEDANLKNYTLFTEDIQNEVQDQVEVSKEAISMNEKKLQEQKVESSSEQSMPTITVASEQIKIKKNLRTRVLELFEEGLLPEEIAKTLDVSITEVQLIIDIFSL